MPNIVFVGKVFSGEGRGKKFVCLPWVKGQIEEKLGFAPYLGTLNVRLSGKEVEKRILLQNAGGLVVEPQTGYYPGVIFRATIDSLECGVVIPIMPNYPNDVLEVIAPVYLRGSLNLADGNTVSVAVRV